MNVGEPTFQIRRAAKFARAVGDQFLLAEDTSNDYTIDYILQIKKCRAIQITVSPSECDRRGSSFPRRHRYCWW